MNKYFGHTILLGIVTALTFQNVALMLSHFVIGSVMILNFICFLKVDPTSLQKEINDRAYQIISCTKSLIILPLIMYALAYSIFYFLNLDINYAVACLLLFASPTAATASVLCLFGNGNFNRSVMHVVLSSILVPITMTILLFFLNVVGGEMNFWKLFATLFLMIFIPLTFAVIVKKMLVSVANRIKNNAQLFSLICILIINMGALKGFVHNASAAFTLYEFLNYLLITSALFAAGFFIAALLERSPQRQDKITTAVNSAWKNIGLTIAIVHLFFPEKMLLAVTLYLLPYNLFMPVFKKFARLPS